MDIKKIIKQTLMEANGMFSNPLKGTGAELASSEDEIRAASRFTLDKIKDSFRKSGIYISDDYLESFIPIGLLKQYNEGFKFKFKIIGGNEDSTEPEILSGKAKYVTENNSNLVLSFVGENGENLYIVFDSKGKDSLDRSFLTKKKNFQKVRNRTDVIMRGLQKGGKFNVKLIDGEDGEESLIDTEEYSVYKIVLMNVGIETSLGEDTEESDDFILPTSSEVKSGDKKPIFVNGRFEADNIIGNIDAQIANELKRGWGNKMRVWASDHKNQIMLQKVGDSSGGFVVVIPKDDRVKRNYKDIKNYNGVDVIIGEKAFADKDITKGIEGTLWLRTTK
jgi:hypothetical protein